MWILVLRFGNVCFYDKLKNVWKRKYFFFFKKQEKESKVDLVKDEKTKGK